MNRPEPDALVHALDRHHALPDPAWRAAFGDVPRGMFVPEFFTARTDGPGGWSLVTPSDPAWSERVHSLDALVTQIGGDDDNARRAANGRFPEGPPTSSSSSPTLMALMLHDLDVSDGQRVLEIGTGTGYNAALLCHRLGADNVVSVDVDPSIIHRAHDRLDILGYRPTLVAGDGRHGIPERGPYDRIIATVAVPRIPAAWIDQTAPGGKILAPLDRGGILTLVTVHDDATATGTILPDYAAFMSTRDSGALDVTRDPVPFDAADHVPARTTALPAACLNDTSHPFEYFAALTIGPVTVTGFTPATPAAPPENWFTLRDGSWACHTTEPDGTSYVREGGPTALWTAVEQAHTMWRDYGRPGRERWGVSVGVDQTTSIWIDAPHDDVVRIFL